MKMDLKTKLIIAIALKIKKQTLHIYKNLRTHFSLDLRKPYEVI
jgi:hypothetical protein